MLTQSDLQAIGKIIDLRSREEIIAQKTQAGAEIGKLSRLYMSGKITLEESEFENVTTRYEDRTKYEALDSSGQRRDILIANNPRNSSDSNIWIKLKREWGCDILIFDAKYYTVDLTDKEIYQMYAYLGDKVARLGIILSKEGKCDRTAKTAMRRIRQDNYGILIFSNQDINNWINEYKEGGSVQKTFFDRYTAYVAGFSP